MTRPKSAKKNKTELAHQQTQPFGSSMKSARLDPSVPSFAIMVSTDRVDASVTCNPNLSARFLSLSPPPPPPNSFSITAMRFWCSFDERMCLTSVVLPDPRKPTIGIQVRDENLEKDCKQNLTEPQPYYTPVRIVTGTGGSFGSSSSKSHRVGISSFSLSLATSSPLFSLAALLIVAGQSFLSLVITGNISNGCWLRWLCNLQRNSNNWWWWSWWKWKREWE